MSTPTINNGAFVVGCWIVIQVSTGSDSLSNLQSDERVPAGGSREPRVSGWWGGDRRHHHPDSEHADRHVHVRLRARQVGAIHE